MNNIRTYKDLTKLIATGEEVKRDLLKALQEIKEYLETQDKPQGVSEGTSYNDYDTIHGSREKLGYEQLKEIIKQASQLNSMLVLQDSSLEYYYKIKKDTDDCINQVCDVTIKVSMLRDKGFTQEEVAELVERSPRTIQRLDKKQREVV